jgi:hypothetical protein
VGARATELSPASPRAEDQRGGDILNFEASRFFKLLFPFLSRRIEFGFFSRYFLTSSILTSSHPTMSSQPLLQTAPGKFDTSDPQTAQHKRQFRLDSLPHCGSGWRDNFPSLKLWMSNTAVTSTPQEKQNDRTSHPTHTTPINPPISTPSPANINQASESPSQLESSPRSSSPTSAPSSHGLTSPSS